MNRILVIAFALVFGVGLAVNAAAQVGGDRPTREEIKKEFDRNGDGKLDQSERQALREAMKERLGRGGRADRPGRSDRPQAGRGQGRRGAFAGRLRAVLDRNGDGRVGPVERRLGMRAIRRMGMRRGQVGEGPGVPRNQDATPRRLGRGDGEQPRIGRRSDERPGAGRRIGGGRGLGLRDGDGRGQRGQAGEQPRPGRQIAAQRGIGARDGSGLGSGPGRQAGACRGACQLVVPKTND